METKWRPPARAPPGQNIIPEDPERDSSTWQWGHRAQPQAGWVDESWEARQCCDVGQGASRRKGWRQIHLSLEGPMSSGVSERVAAPDVAAQGNPELSQTHTDKDVGILSLYVCCVYPPASPAVIFPIFFISFLHIPQDFLCSPSHSSLPCDCTFLPLHACVHTAPRYRWLGPVVY